MKVAVFDFDGTLHHPGAGISAADVAALRAWREAGHVSMCATGRSRSKLARGLAGAEGLFDFHVLSNGSAATTVDDQLLYTHPVPNHVITEAVARFGTTPGLAVCGTTWGDNDAIFADTTADLSAEDGRNLIAGFTTMSAADIPAHEFALLVFWLPHTAATTPANTTEIIAWAEAHPEVNYARNANFVDVMAPGRDKAAGIIDVLAHLGHDRADVELYTFGDSWNDLPMHAIADVSHSFPYSPADVQSATDHVIESVGETLLSYLAAPSTHSSESTRQ